MKVYAVRPDAARTVLLLLGLLLSGLLQASPKHAAPEKGHAATLKEIHGRIETLSKDLARNEESRASLADELKEVETAISKANRHLRELTDNRLALEAEIRGLEQQATTLGRQIEQQQKQLAGLLYRQFIHGDDDPLKLVLSGESPDASARDRYFLTQLSQAKVRLLADLKDSVATKQKLAEARRTKAEQLTQLGVAEQEGRNALLVKQKERQAVLARIGDKIKAQRREIDVLRANEQRLTQLIAALARAPRPVAPAKPVLRPQSLTPKAPRLTDPPPDKPAETATLRNDALPERETGGTFSALRGHLRLPLKGDIAGRFGVPRADSGASWKGLFIRAAEGSDVHAVAAGRVVFSDWLRGFGNLLIIDHGEGYLSIYGYNQSLYRESGQTVKAGDTVAAAGNSGGQGESGLYFELRHQGQPFDPLKWASLR